MKVNNKLIGFVFDKFDFPIRFLYSKFSLNNSFFWKLYSSDFKKLDSQFEEMSVLLRNKKFNFRGKVCLELGPGNSYINAYNLLMNGAKKVILIDKYPRYMKTKRQKEFFYRELDYIKQKYAKSDLFFIKNGNLNAKYIEFIKGDFKKINFVEKINFVMTVSVFEHIKNVESNIKKLSEVISKRGLMYHSIDLRDHYNFNNPFLFYKYSKKIWEKYLTKEGVSYTNRIRCDEFISLFKKYGFEIINEKTKRFPVGVKKINKEFKDKLDLEIGTWRVLFRKK